MLYEDATIAELLAGADQFNITLHELSYELVRFTGAPVLGT